MAKNSNLHKAKKAKQDEFYTPFETIQEELIHYKPYFKDKTIFCNCDDPTASNFWKYFALNFEFFGLKKVIATHYNPKQPTYKLELTGYNQEAIKTPLKQNGDFRSPECLELLKEADMIVTNPPFSLFREYVDTLITHNKQFIIIGSMNAISYKEIFKLIKENKIWLGHTYPKEFFYYENDKKLFKKFGNIAWYTNLPVKRFNEEIILYKKYNPEDYPVYDNYPAINVDKVNEIPCDYDGKMGVPVSFLTKYNPNQFEIIDGIGRYSMLTGPTEETKGKYLTKINGVPKYARIIIRRKK